jgi:ubiquinone/menaquinone biosynthesis C-methylase UbiE
MSAIETVIRGEGSSAVSLDPERYYHSCEWQIDMPVYSLDRDIWGICYAPTARPRVKLAISLIQAFARQARTIVDVGSGPGIHYGSFLNDFGASDRSLILIDLSFTALRLAAVRMTQEKLDARLIQANAERLPLGDNSADLLICGEVLEHLLDDRSAVAEFYRILRDDGLAYISVPLERRPRWPWHVRCYDLGGFRDIIAAAGFKIERVECSGLITVPIWHLIRYPCWVVWLVLTGNLVRQLRREKVPSFYISRFYLNFVLPAFDCIQKLDEWVSAKCGLGKTLHCLVRKI